MGTLADMTLTTLIAANAILSAVVVYGLLVLLVHGIRSDLQRVEARVGALRRREIDRLAA
jgi:hypothetical protein